MEVDKEERKDSNKHHVHFGEANDSFDHDSNIGLIPTTNGYNVHLGFLQINHWYQISFTFNASQAMGKLFRVEDEIQANINLIDLSIAEEKSDTKEYKIKLELFAHREKLQKEKVVLKSCDNPSQTITLVLNARVLGKGKGTPLLRNGIQCIGVKKEDDDSDASDWQGYEKVI